MKLTKRECVTYAYCYTGLWDTKILFTAGSFTLTRRWEIGEIGLLFNDNRPAVNLNASCLYKSRFVLLHKLISLKKAGVCMHNFNIYMYRFLIHRIDVYTILFLVYSALPLGSINTNHSFFRNMLQVVLSKKKKKCSFCIILE